MDITQLRYDLNCKHQLLDGTGWDVAGQLRESLDKAYAYALVHGHFTEARQYSIGMDWIHKGYCLDCIEAALAAMPAWSVTRAL